MDGRIAESDERSEWLHVCGELPERGVEIRRTNELWKDDSLGWVLSIYCDSTESDLEKNHHLEQVEEMVWNTLLEIRYCPFCAEKLAPAAESAAPMSDPEHYDYSL